MEHESSYKALSRKLSSYVQELLCYKNSKTTEIYIHVSSTYLSWIKSLLDNITGDNKYEKEYDFRQSGRYTNHVRYERMKYMFSFGAKVLLLKKN